MSILPVKDITIASDTPFDSLSIPFINIKTSEVTDKFDVEVEMTLTSPNCPVAESLPEEVRTKVENLEKVNKSEVTITWEPTWDSSFMSDVAKLELGML